MQINQLREILDCDGIVFLSYGGRMTQDLIVGMTSALEKESEKNEMSMSISINILTIFVEMSQNIMNYSKQSVENQELSNAKGLVFVGYKEKENQYFVCSQNILSIEKKDKILPKIEEVMHLDKAELKLLYREKRKSGKDKHNKGAGIGFIEIARRCDRIEYEFSSVKESSCFFNFKAIINNK